MAHATDPNSRLNDYSKQYQQLIARLSDLGFIWPGSIQRRMMKCGQSGCACHSDTEARHGPYLYWTTKKASKTVGKLLTPEEADLYGEWIANRKKLEAIVRQMKALSKRAASAVIKTRAPTAKRKTRTRKTPKRST
jgi:hypothetical protein